MKEEVFPLVSIIVPVYNVYTYIEKCLISLINQTYENIEIILVNDGSTDKSGEICEQYVENDKRVKLIHQANQGLSAARNTGITNSKGEYLMFVDSDDWVSERIVEVLISNIQSKGLKLSMVDYHKVNAEDLTDNFEVSFDSILIEKEVAIKRMLSGEWWSACMKLYHISIFNNIRFPVGRNNEDYAILIHVFEQCEYVSFNKSKLYYYLTRPNSITTSQLNDRSFDEIGNCLHVFEHVKNLHPQFLMEAEYNLGASLIKLISAIYLDNTNKYVCKLTEFKTLLHIHYDSLMQSSIMPFQQKIILFLLRYCNRFLNVIFLKLYSCYKSIR